MAQSSAVRNLLAAFHDLTSQRDEIDAARQSVRAALTSLGYTGPLATGMRDAESETLFISLPSLPKSPSEGEDKLLDVLRSHTEIDIWSLRDIQQALRDADVEWKESTTRSTVARMSREGRLERVSRGRYRVISRDLADSLSLTDTIEVETTSAPGASEPLA